MPPIESTDLMHATLRPRPFSDREWLFEWKYDGFRCLARKEGDQVDLISRQGKSLNRSFPDIIEAVAAVPGDFVWVAELAVGSGAGTASFGGLQQRAKTTSLKNVGAAARTCPARLYVFDMLASGESDLRSQPLTERKAHLRDAFADAGTLVYATGVVGVGIWVFEQVHVHGFEGMVAKRLTSPYTRGRTLDWIKIKNPDYERTAALGFGRSG